MEDNHAVILFSGGADSSAAAVLSLEKHKSVTLLTFNNGYNLFIKRSCLMARRLKQKHSHRSVTHKIIDNRGVFDAVIRSNFSWGKYLKNPGFFCFSERAAMYIRTAIFCLENQIKYIYDGNNCYQGQTALTQMPEVSIVINDFFQNYNLFYISPIYGAGDLSESLLLNKGLMKKNELYQRKRIFCKKDTFLPLDLIKGIFDKISNKFHPVFFIETLLQFWGRIRRFKSYPQEVQRKRILEAKLHFIEKFEFGREYVNTYCKL